MGVRLETLRLNRAAHELRQLRYTRFRGVASAGSGVPLRCLDTAELASLIARMRETGAIELVAESSMVLEHRSRSGLFSRLLEALA